MSRNNKFDVATAFRILIMILIALAGYYLRDTSSRLRSVELNQAKIMTVLGIDSAYTAERPVSALSDSFVLGGQSMPETLQTE